MNAAHGPQVMNELSAIEPAELRRGRLVFELPSPATDPLQASPMPCVPFCALCVSCQSFCVQGCTCPPPVCVCTGPCIIITARSADSAQDAADFASV